MAILFGFLALLLLLTRNPRLLIAAIVIAAAVWALRLLARPRAGPARPKDFYRILQVQPDADPLIIKSAYRTLMNEMKMHPDMGGATRRAQEINEAYDVLSDSKKRRAYDAARP